MTCRTDCHTSKEAPNQERVATGNGPVACVFDVAKMKGRKSAALDLLSAAKTAMDPGVKVSIARRAGPWKLPCLDSLLILFVHSPLSSDDCQKHLRAIEGGAIRYQSSRTQL